MMTRRALQCQKEINLQQALQELKVSRELCTQLTNEREDNENILLDALNNNDRLKSELSALHSQYTDTVGERDRLQCIIDGFDQCGSEYEQALKRTSTLEKELCDAHHQITELQEAAQCSVAQKTQSLFDELVSAGRENGPDACCDTPTVTIDLTNDDSVRVAACTRNKFSKNKLKKYVKINKFISKTKRQLKKQKHIVSHIRTKREKIDLIDKLKMCTLQLENSKLGHDSEIQQLQCELASVEESLKSISNRYEKSQEVIREYSLAMDELLRLSNSNQQRFDSLVANHSCHCQPPVSPGPVSAASSTSQLCAELNKNKIKNKTIMFCDEIGKTMGQLLNTRMGQPIINNCLPYSDLHEIMQNISKYNFDQCSNLVIWLGNRGNVNKFDLIKYVETLLTLQVNRIVMFTFPYSNSLPQAENDLRYKLNQTLHTMSCNNNFHLIDINSIIDKNYYQTKGKYYLPNYYKRQVAVSLSYYFSITAKNLATNNASIEHIIDMTLDITPSHLN